MDFINIKQTLGLSVAVGKTGLRPQWKHIHDSQFKIGAHPPLKQDKQFDRQS